MCRNIKPLFNFAPPATKKEIHDASLQFVRKISGFQNPSALNEIPMQEAVASIEPILNKLIHSLKTNAEPKNRETEAKKAHQKALKRFG